MYSQVKGIVNDFSSRLLYGESRANVPHSLQINKAELLRMHKSMSE